MQLGTSISQAATELIHRQGLSQMNEMELADAISSFLPLRTESIRLAGQVLRWYKPINNEPLLEEAVELQNVPAADIDPFWSADWRAAYGLDQYLARLQLDNRRVLELGAGSGRAGIAAAMRGACVTITDTVDVALLVARLNGWLMRERLSYERLRWGDDHLSVDPFPLILSSDLVYDPNHFPQLEKLCASSPGPGRPMATERTAAP